MPAFIHTYTYTHIRNQALPDDALDVPLDDTLDGLAAALLARLPVPQPGHEAAPRDRGLLPRGEQWP